MMGKVAHSGEAQYENTKDCVRGRYAATKSHMTETKDYLEHDRKSDQGRSTRRQKARPVGAFRRDKSNRLSELGSNWKHI